MFRSIVEIRRSFHQLQNFSTPILGLRQSSRRHCPTVVSPFENFVRIDSLIIKALSMSNLKPIRCGHGFHSRAEMSTPNLSAEAELLDPRSSSCDNPSTSSVQTTPEIEKKYVHRVYDAIAPHFSATRFAKWPKVAGFLNSLSPDSLILDAGCGNGKYLGFNPNCFYIGCDISPSLIDICARKGHEVLIADVVNLPYRNNYGDAAISIAVLHHLSTESRRRKAIEELIRVVRKGGLVLITVWAVEQEDQSLLTKWTPLSHRYNEGWISPSSPRTPRNSSTISLESIPETGPDRHYFTDFSNDYNEGWISPSSPQTPRNSSTISLESIPETGADCHHFTDFSNDEPDQLCHGDKGLENQLMMAGSALSRMTGNSASANRKADTNQEYFVPWHLPYHRAEISGASASALATGLAKKDDKKGSMVYNRYYHVFAEGELERLVTGIKNATILEQFYDKSNWCIVLEKI